MINRKSEEAKTEVKPETKAAEKPVKETKAAEKPVKETKAAEKPADSAEKAEVKRKPKISPLKLSNMITAGEIKDITQLTKCGKKAIAPVLCKELESLGLELPKSFVKKASETFVLELDTLLWAVLSRKK